MYFQLAVLCLSIVQLSMGDMVVEEVVTKKEIALLGGWNDRSIESAEVQEATEHAVNKFNSNSKSKKLFKLVSITSAQSQVTNMINYKIDAVLGKTNCFKSENRSLNDCHFGKKQLDCHFEVTLDLRTEKYEITASNCKKQTEGN